MMQNQRDFPCYNHGQELLKGSLEVTIISWKCKHSISKMYAYLV